MPVELVAHAVGFVARLGAEAAFDVLFAVGAGEDRKAAITRCVVFPILLAAIAGLLLWLLIPTLPDSTGALLFALALALFGGYLARRLFEEITRLRHWGEPELTASPIGLTMPRRNRVVRWEHIVSVTPQRRGRRGRVRIDVALCSGGAMFVPTTRPEALAATIAAEQKAWEPRS
nr:hypothetical protein [Polymorphobacter sp.]